MANFITPPPKITYGFLLLRNICLILLAIISIGALLLWQTWQIRSSIDSIEWPLSVTTEIPLDAVTVTWLGTTTLLFDDRETQILIDGTFTRVSTIDAILRRPVRSDIATINYAMANFEMNRLAAIIPIHSHFDHALDIGHVANRSRAVILGSESTAEIARGAKVPVDQYQVLGDGETRQFGNFKIKLIATIHAPIGLSNEEIFPGTIDAPVLQPSPISSYKTGTVWSVLLTHPRGSTLIHGSAGIVEGKLKTESADIVLLGIGGLSKLGRDYTQKLWDQTVLATGATRVIGIHYDDFSAPFGEVRVFPDLLDKVQKTAAWINDLDAVKNNQITVELPQFGRPITLY